MFQNTSRPSGKKREKQFWLAYLLLIPSFVLFALFSYYPMVKTVINSFAVTTKVGDFIRWNGFSNWINIFRDVFFGKYLLNTFVFAVLNFVLTFFPALFLAMLSAKKAKGSRLYQTFYALPMVIAATTVAAIWKFVYLPEGLLNQIVGGSKGWLLDTDSAMMALAVVTSWGHIAGRYLYLMVGFRNVSDDLIEAATLDGAGWWTRMRKIMIPMASPQIFFVLFTSIVSAFKTFTQINLLTGGGPAGSTNTLVYWMYQKYQYGQIAAASCVALLLFLIIFIATRIQFLFEKKTVFYQ